MYFMKNSILDLVEKNNVTSNVPEDSNFENGHGWAWMCEDL